MFVFLFISRLFHLQVRNAIQALQEMTYSTLQSQIDLGGRFPPARSIPNLPNETRSIVQTADAYALARSTSQPAETWGRDLIVDSSLCESHLNGMSDTAKSLVKVGISISTQTDANKIDLPAIEKFIVQNPRLVLNILGIIEPTYHIECELQPQTLIAIPEADGSSPEATSPPDNQKRFAFGIANPMPAEPAPSIVAWNSPQNSTNKGAGVHCRSTDTLLPTSSDDCLLQSNENLSGGGTVVQTISPITVQSALIDSSVAAAASVCAIAPTTIGVPRDIAIKPSIRHSHTADASRSNSATSLSSSNSSLSSPPAAPSTSSQRIHTSVSGHKRKSSNSRKDSKHCMSGGASCSTGGINNISSSGSSSSSCGGSGIGAVSNPSRMPPIGAYAEKMLTTADHFLKEDDETVNYDELNEKCALLCNDVRKNSINRSSITDLQKRNHLMPRPPFNHRFSAGDADKLEKGIKNIPSTRSLKDS